MKNNDINIVEYVSGTRKYRVSLVPGRRGRVMVEYFKNGQFVSMKRFEVGDEAEYASWPRRIGPIVSIGAKTVTLKTSEHGDVGLDGGYTQHRGGAKRLEAEEFGWRNVNIFANDLSAVQSSTQKGYN